MTKKKEVLTAKKEVRKRPKSNSGVSEHHLKFWGEKYHWGDFQKIKKSTKLSRPTIKSAFAGSATTDVANAITNYYIKN